MKKYCVSVGCIAEGFVEIFSSSSVSDARQVFEKTVEEYRSEFFSRECLKYSPGDSEVNLAYKVCLDRIHPETERIEDEIECLEESDLFYRDEN